mgnify:CR=1 FL=1
MASAKITQLQLLQQNLQNVLSQKQQIESEIIEVNSAVSQLQSTSSAYKIVGKIMVSVARENLISELGARGEVLEIRLQNCTKQEEKIKASMEKVQQEVVQEMRSKNE